MNRRWCSTAWIGAANGCDEQKTLKLLSAGMQLRDLQHVRDATLGKRILLTEEILNEMQYEDTSVLDLLRHGSPLAGDIPKCEAFEELFKPCMLTMPQLLKEAPQRNQAVMAACKSSGDLQIDLQVLHETREEVKRGWAIGPLDTVPAGGVISRRFPLPSRFTVVSV